MGKYSEEPQFSETQALLAFMSEDEEEAERILRDLMSGELRKLKYAANDLARTTAEILGEKLAEGRR